MDRTVASRFSSRSRWTTDDIRSCIETTKVVLFSRGSVEKPRCGYSRTAIETLSDSGKPFEVVDVNTDPSAAAALRATVGPVHLPALFVNGSLISSPETIEEMCASGEILECVKRAYAA